MSAQPNDGGPAFPVDHQFVNPRATPEELRIACGISVRDYFAAQANAALIVALSATRGELGYSDEAMVIEAARLSVISADAVLAARATKGGTP